MSAAIRAQGNEVNPFQNPLHWTRQHQLVWGGLSAFGAILGLLLGYIHSPYFSLVQNKQAFTAWLSISESYWSWPLFGFLVSSVTFYLAQLFRTSN